MSSGPATSAADLIIKSVDLILEHQAPSGAYVAGPTFPTYRYSWLRDGSFIGYAMLRAGKPESCRKFLDWTDRVIRRHSDRMRCYRSTPALAPPPTRYTLDGDSVDDDWPNHQIDGYGAWLWLLAEYAEATEEDHLIHRYRESLRLTVTYLADAWNRPSFDCWEEHGGLVHASTLACVYGGLAAINRLLGEREFHELAGEVRDYLLHMTSAGRFRKSSGDDGIDASLLWLSTPFRVVDPLDPLMRETVRTIEERLLIDGGLMRYEGDTFYGGGRWILLTCWLGWYYAQTGKTDQAMALVRWAELQATADGLLPEQVPGAVTDPAHLRQWEEKWGPVATPLLWSHAMYIVLRKKLEENA